MIKKIILGLCLVLSLASCDDLNFNDVNQKQSKEISDNEYQKAKVTKIVDGDTIYADIDGLSEKIRLVGINTPEIDVEDLGDEYFGRDATIFSTKILKDKKIYLEKDKSDRDKHGRLLRFVWLEKPADPANPTDEEIKELLVNALLVEGGYAYANVYPPDDRYSDILKNLEKEAKQNKLGIWDDKARQAYENGENTLENNQGNLIKGNKNSMIYHLPGGDGYDKIADHNVIYFESEKEAQEAGFRKANN